MSLGLVIDVAAPNPSLSNPERSLPSSILLLQPRNQRKRCKLRQNSFLRVFANERQYLLIGKTLEIRKFCHKLPLIRRWVRSMPGIWQSRRLQSLNQDVFDGRPTVGEVPLLPTLHERGRHAARVRIQVLPQYVLRGPLHLRGLACRKHLASRLEY